MEDFAIKFTKLFIENEWHDSITGRRFETINPATQKHLAYVAEATELDIDKAVTAAIKAFHSTSPWRCMSPCDRGTLIYRLADLIEQHSETLLMLEVLNAGKPISDARIDLIATLKTFRYYAGWADKIHGQTLPQDPFFSYSKIEPVGVCGQIIPWNYPLLMLSWKMAPALAAGCTIVLKPSEFTPLSALYIGHLIIEAGFPPGVVNIVPGYGPIAGAAIVKHKDVNKIAFTGSTSVGKEIMRMAADTCKRVSLELGGKSPLVISSKCKDVRKAVEIAQEACFANMGQCCCAGTRTFVHESIYDEFVILSAELAQKRKVGNPLDEKTVQGPQINKKQMEKVLQLIESGKQEGAKCLSGGKKLASDGFFIEPTVFADVTDNMRIAREEIFGPVQQILKYRTLEEVIDRCNQTDYGLAAGIITDDMSEAETFINSIKAGSIWVNCYDPGSVSVPFGGYKQSGFGRELGQSGLLEYCETKSIVIKSKI
ncbi:aldehyde dehydrogenase X, mitochondrial-like protein [Sarcoptes scabiei]|uniref:Aldehyde dehydrogenase X, mitochondrial-like protein n=1 Tax=Sarcoptes scabiei TaxID=52283 RepID=A0A132A9U6_SARSC|nr:aldehyde dehydrogenase X, mitochondrial-like protein [Sarcoptes scabiei]